MSTRRIQQFIFEKYVRKSIFLILNGLMRDFFFLLKMKKKISRRDFRGFILKILVGPLRRRPATKTHQKQKKDKVIVWCSSLPLLSLSPVITFSFSTHFGAPLVQFYLAELLLSVSNSITHVFLQIINNLETTIREYDLLDYYLFITQSN
jgi:hypothetical protein